MFTLNKYTKIYNAIISRAQQRSLPGYVERHHIIPKSLGGTNDKSNIVSLTGREHFICHLLLIKMVEQNVKHKMVYAAWQQSRPSKHKTVKVTSRIYEMLRSEMSKSYTGVKRAPFNDQWLANMKAGAKNRKTVTYTPERLEKLANNRHDVAGWNKGLSMDLSSEQLQAISLKFSLANKGKAKKRKTCPYCNKDIAVNTYPRWHGDNCKNKPK